MSVRKKLMLAFMDETDTLGELPLYEAIVRRLVQWGIAGATVQAGIMGYGMHHQVHRKRLFGVSDDRPITIAVVDEEEKLRRVAPEVRKMVAEGLVLLMNVVNFSDGADEPVRTLPFPATRPNGHHPYGRVPGWQEALSSLHGEFERQAERAGSGAHRDECRGGAAHEPGDQLRPARRGAALGGAEARPVQMAGRRTVGECHPESADARHVALVARLLFRRPDLSAGQRQPLLPPRRRQPR